jgi:hypothetical protein
MRITYAIVMSMLASTLTCVATYMAVDPMRATGLEQHAIVATFLEAYCNHKRGDQFNAGAYAALSVVTQRAGLGPIATAEAAKCMVFGPPTAEDLAELAKIKSERKAELDLLKASLRAK